MYKRKLHSLRFILAQVEPEKMVLADRIKQRCKFKSELASVVYDNPYVTGASVSYIFNKILYSLDLILPENWDDYCTDDRILLLCDFLTTKKIQEVSHIEDKDLRNTHIRFRLTNYNV